MYDNELTASGSPVCAKVPASLYVQMNDLIQTSPATKKVAQDSLQSHKNSHK